MSKEPSRATRQNTTIKGSNYNSNSKKKEKETPVQNDVFWLTIKNKGFAYNIKQG